MSPKSGTKKKNDPFIISRFVNDIPRNSRELSRDPDGNVMEFDTAASAAAFAGHRSVDAAAEEWVFILRRSELGH